MAASAKKAARRALYWVMSTLVWRAPRPRAMLRKGRSLDPLFAPQEMLYLRCTLEGTETITAADGTPYRRVRPAHIHFPDQSVNRQKYSRPWHVLLPSDDERSQSWILCGSAQVPVSGIPPAQQSAGNVHYEFTVEHDPLDDNFGHAELRVYKNGQRERDKRRINSVVKKTYRQLLSEQTRIALEPLI